MIVSRKGLLYEFKVSVNKKEEVVPVVQSEAREGKCRFRKFLRTRVQEREWLLLIQFLPAAWSSRLSCAKETLVPMEKLVMLFQVSYEGIFLEEFSTVSKDR